VSSAVRSGERSDIAGLQFCHDIREFQLDGLVLDEALEILANKFGWGSREVQDYHDHRIGLTPDE